VPYRLWGTYGNPPSCRGVVGFLCDSLKLLTDRRSPFPRPTLTELTMIIRWWMRVTLLTFMPSRVAKRPIKIRNEKRTNRT
jgi:hypothetical protein